MRFITRERHRIPKLKSMIFTSKGVNTWGDTLIGPNLSLMIKSKKSFINGPNPDNTASSR